ncbi:IS110 family transposase [Rhizobium sp. 2YAF20]|uniref:IS110 family transposase n=1 Tax=Rhizobium sp. 2YAF20 TaxID=3233027 RepID=UPI003F99EA18
MNEIATIGLDLAKQVFQVHAVDAQGRKLFNRKLRRAEMKDFFQKIPACVVGMEACASSHYWAREIEALGHKALLIPAQYVKPFVKRGKTDAADAEAIALTVSQESVRNVPIKSAEQQAIIVLVKARSLFIRQRTNATNALRSHMAEFGIISAVGTKNVMAAAAVALGDGSGHVPTAARSALSAISDEIELLDSRISRLDGEIASQAKQNDDIRRLMTIPGVGVVTASTIAAHVADPAGFKSARHFAAWIGLTPKAHSSGGKMRNGGISKMGNTVLRSLLVMGAVSVLRWAAKDEKTTPWLRRLLVRRPFRVVAVALANKTARTIWALLNKGGVYRLHDGVHLAATASSLE